MFGINLNVTSKDAYACLAVPVAVGSVALVSKLAYSWWNSKPSVPTKEGGLDFAKKALVMGGVGAALGLTTAYMTKQPLGRETLKAAGYTFGTAVALASTAHLTKGSHSLVNATSAVSAATPSGL